MTILSRPPFQLRSLPIRMRWEVTRRNPYYSTMWKLGRAEHRKEITPSPEDGLLRQAAIPCLGLIGVSGEPVDPALPFEALGADQLKQGWLTGVVHPITMRGLAALLIAALPKETLGQIGMMCLTAACDDVDGKTPKKIEAMQQLTTDASPGLNDYPDEPLVSINPAASERKIGEAIDLLLKEWKDQRGLDERRDRSDKHDEYLEVWDLREGWSNGTYNRTTERTFLEIAESTKRSISTLNNQYCRAFELIVGQPYSRERWYASLGPIKFCRMTDTGAARTMRPAGSPTPRPVPETTLSPVGNDNSVLTLIQQVEVKSDIGFVALAMDVETLVKRGLSDDQIARELEEDEENIAYIRQRGDTASLEP